jgi:glycosyltransferase involved in cell wall biosynthesis
MSSTLHIIEPTLRSRDGHYASLVECIVHECRPRFDEIVVWGGRGGRLTSIEGARLERYFPRAARKVVLFHLLTQLLRRPGRILISTATTTDLSIMRLAHEVVRRPKGRSAAFVHFYAPARKRLQRRLMMQWVVNGPQPIRLVTPTAGAAVRLESVGFRDVHVVPYPMKWNSTPTVSTQEPRLLVPGGVRQDKGFFEVVDYVAWLHDRGLTVGIDVQVTLGHYHRSKMPRGLDEAVSRLRAIGYPHLRVIDRTPEGEYAGMFRGCVVLQPYHATIFADRVSGVTLDAFAAGSPVIVNDGTWSAVEVRRTGAGVVLDGSDPASIHAAVEKVFVDIRQYREAACGASDLKRAEQLKSGLADAMAE